MECEEACKYTSIKAILLFLQERVEADRKKSIKMSTEQDILRFTEGFREHRSFEQAHAFILQKEAHLEGMVRIVLQERSPYAEHISWILVHFAAKYPPLLFPFVPRLLQCLEQTQNGTLKRNMLCIFLNLPPLDAETAWFDRLLHYLRDPESKPAVKVNALKLTEHWFLHRWPELAAEVRETLQLLAEDDKPSVRSVIRNFNKKWK